VFWLLVVFFS